MQNKIDYSIATSEQIEAFLYLQLKNVRLSMNMTQVQLAEESGVSAGTIHRMEDGKTVSLNTFIRILIAFKLQNNLQSLLPDSTIRPIERVKISQSERKRARPLPDKKKRTPWTWGDETEDQK